MHIDFVNRPEANYAAVPIDIVYGDLSADALGVLVYLAARPEGYETSVAALRERFGFGQGKWQRISRELRGAGLIR